MDIASKRWNSDAVKVLSNYVKAISEFEGTFDAYTAKSMLGASAESEEIKLGKVMQAVRLSVTGSGTGPDLMEVFAILGAQEVAKRIQFALDTLPVIA
jgi:glutamyl-tRNA synthetase